VSVTTVRGSVGGREVVIETGRLAGQANGSVTVQTGDTTVLVTATANQQLREGVDFFPLTVDVEERMYAAGKIPGSFFRREGRPTEQAILTCRLIDRPLRPSFADGFRCETQVVSTILSVDGVNPYDIISLNGASSALMISGIPFEGPVGAVTLGLRDGEWIVNPTYQELEGSIFELTVAGRRNTKGEIDIMMVEAGSTENGLRLVAEGQPPSDEERVTQGLEAAKAPIGEFIDLQLELVRQVEVPEVEWPVVVDYSDELFGRVEAVAGPKLAEVIRISGKHERSVAEDRVAGEVIAELGLEEEEHAAAKKALKKVEKTLMRKRVLDEGVRLDGRGPTDIRPLQADVGLVPRTHGSGLFQRGETQVLNISTLGMLKMEQMLDTLAVEETKRYMHHYNFPPFSTGEAGFMRGPKRREIGHGALAEKAVLPVVPTTDEFPYALRLVSEVLSSNGSTSMASVCASSLSLMDAGVPISEPVAGIAMGLISLDDRYVTLTDIIGAEDALGDMDFKVAGTAGVITALQLDTKIEGLPSHVLAAALQQAREARLLILEVMRGAIEGPRVELNQWAPRIEAVRIPKDKIGEIIGPKGKHIRELEEETGASIEIEEDGAEGIVRIGSPDGDSLAAAKARVLAMAFPPEAEVGKEYEGEVVNITKFGAFVNILPGRDGLLHISKIDANRRVDRVEDYLALGDTVKVVVREVDRMGKVNLDLAAAIEPKPDAKPGRRSDERRDDRRDERRDSRRDDRGGDRGRSDKRHGGERTRGAARTDEHRDDKPNRKVVSFEDEFERDSGD
jgi:polyribonucleotide nucleotidyltransferase